MQDYASSAQEGAQKAYSKHCTYKNGTHKFPNLSFMVIMIDHAQFQDNNFQELTPSSNLEFLDIEINT